jgi:ribosomal protein S18 acetylase RimI-like enzyme
MPSAPVVVRTFTRSDFDTCLRVFESNLPKYFAESERAEFVDFLGAHDGEYLVVELNGAVRACGGSHVKDGIGRLCWGMVEQSHHRAALGSALLVHRLNRMFSRALDLQQVQIDTSQHSAGFYERFGFKVQASVPNGFGEGLDCLAMALSREGWAAQSRCPAPFRQS